MQKISRKIFILIFLVMLVLPVIFVNRQSETLSTDEKRVLAPFPTLYDAEKGFNIMFSRDFENWLNDNIGFRSAMVAADARVMYHGFKVLGNDSDYYLGPNGELCYITDSILKDYRHLNLRIDETNDQIGESYRVFRDYIEDRGIQYYYFQCWDKQSVYPEHFPTTITRFGDLSKTDQIVESIEKAGVDVISSKEALTAAKDRYDTYSVWGDPTHWTDRGSYIGYLELMEAINRRNNGKYRVLTEDDYDITTEDLGDTIFGVIHEECLLERFTVKNPQGHSNEPDYYDIHGDNYGDVFCNDNAGNNDTLVILGDSYFETFLLDDLAESFARVVIVEGDKMEKIDDIIDTYHPQIIVEEHAERRDRSMMMIDAAKAISERAADN